MIQENIKIKEDIGLIDHVVLIDCLIYYSKMSAVLENNAQIEESRYHAREQRRCELELYRRLPKNENCILAIENLQELCRKYVVQIYCSSDGYDFEAWYDKTPAYCDDFAGKSKSKTFEEGIISLNKDIELNLTKLLENK